MAICLEGHVVWAIVGTQAGEIVMQDDIEHPVEPVLDAPMGANGLRERLWIELGRREIIAPFSLGFAVALDLGFDEADHRNVRKARFVCVAAIREEPIDIVAQAVAAVRPWSASVVS